MNERLFNISINTSTLLTFRFDSVSNSTIHYKFLKSDKLNIVIIYTYYTLASIVYTITIYTTIISSVVSNIDLIIISKRISVMLPPKVIAGFRTEIFN